MQSKVKVKMNNNYHVELIDSTTGKLKQHGDFHNITVQGIASLLTGLASNPSTSGEATYSYNSLRASNILHMLSVGSGTAQPAFTDTNLTTPLWSMTASTASREWIDDYTVRATGIYTFPATSSYVGTVTEVGLWHNIVSSYDIRNLCTHALLTDSEGQQISFNKTDLDILTITVTVEVSLTSSDSSFHIFKRCDLLNYISGIKVLNGDAWYNTMFGRLNACRFDLDISNKTSDADAIDTAITTNESFAGRLKDGTKAYIRYPKTRLAATTITSETYYKYVAIPGIGYWELTDATVFPPYGITNIPIGTGDGTKTVFNNPLSYFKHNTDKVYKNGVQLTRGTDYTISSASNVNCLPEITQDLFSIAKVSSAVSRTVYGEASVKPLMLPASGVYYKVKDLPSNYGFGFNSANPLYIEYDEPTTLNCMRSHGLGFFYTNNFYPQTMPSGVTFYLDYSTDGINYTEVDSVTTTQTGGAFMLDFDDRTAKYWRIRTSFNVGSGTVIVSGTTSQLLTLNYKNPNIVFSTAPADGDVLTMDVIMDRAMKNDKFVLDVECKLSFDF